MRIPEDNQIPKEAQAVLEEQQLQARETKATAKEALEQKVEAVLKTLPATLTAETPEQNKQTMVTTYLLNRLTQAFKSDIEDKHLPAYITVLKNDPSILPQSNDEETQGPAAGTRLNSQMQIDQAMATSPNKDAFETAIRAALPALRHFGNATHVQQMLTAAADSEKAAHKETTPNKISERAATVSTALQGLESNLRPFEGTNNVVRINDTIDEINTLKTEVEQSALLLAALPNAPALLADYQEKEKALQRKISELYNLLKGIRDTSANIGSLYQYNVSALLQLDQITNAHTPALLLQSQYFFVSDRRDETQKLDYEQKKNAPSKNPMFINRLDHQGESKTEVSDMRWDPEVAASALRELKEEYIDKSERSFKIFGKKLDIAQGFIPGMNGVKRDNNGGINRIHFKNEETLNIYLELYKQHYKQKMEKGQDTQIEARPEANEASIQPENQAALLDEEQNEEQNEEQRGSSNP